MKNRYVLLADLPLIGLAAWGAFTARFDWRFFDSRPEFVPYLLAAIIIKPIVFWALGMYRRYWRYTSTQDLAVVFTAVSASSLAMAILVAVGLRTVIDEFSRVVVINDWVLTLATAGGLRVAIRIIGDSFNRSPAGKGVARRVLIIGAGAAGNIVAREMRRNPQLGMEPAGFLDDDPQKIGKHVAGLRVFGATTTLPDVIEAHRVGSVVIAMPTAPGRVLRTIVEMCRDAGVKSQTIPGVFELLDGHVSIGRLRNVEIADLLRRSPVRGDSRAGEFAAGRVVLITGAGGSIGSELSRQIAGVSPSRLVLLGHGENSIFDIESMIRMTFPDVATSSIVADIRDDTRLEQVFSQVKPHIVFHAAAHKHVPLMEENPEEAITNNVIGTRNVVAQALRVGTERFVLISTDKAVAPSSVMGASKRVAEAIVRRAAEASGRAFVVVRFGNVLGSRGSVVNTFKRQIEQGGPLTVTHPDMTRFFMTIPEAVHLVLQASGTGTGGELFVLDMGEPVKVVDLAKDLIKLSGLDEDEIPIVFTGVRRGEKLEEELFERGMNSRPTGHAGVLDVVGSDPLIGPDLDDLIRQLDEAAQLSDPIAIRSLFERIDGDRRGVTSASVSTASTPSSWSGTSGSNA